MKAARRDLDQRRAVRRGHFFFQERPGRYPFPLELPAVADQAVIDDFVGNAHGNIDRVRELLEQNPDIVNARATWNESAIEAASQMGNQPLIEFLFDYGAPCDFFTACVLGRMDQVKEELEADPVRAMSHGVHGLSSLYFAAIGGQQAVAETLVREGADVNDSCEAGAPIHGAVLGGNREMVAWLLQQGANPALPDHEGRDAKQLAESLNRPELVALFA